MKLKHQIALYAVLGVFILGLTSCVMEAAVAPAPALPVAAPAVEVPAAPLTPALPLTIPLPGLHDTVVPRDHAVERHGEKAHEARRIIEDPDSNCQFFHCDGPSGPGTSVLRQCVDSSSSTYALQYIWYNEQTGAWTEGTAFTQGQNKALNYRANKNCRAAGESFTYSNPPSALLDWLKRENV